MSASYRAARAAWRLSRNIAWRFRKHRVEQRIRHVDPLPAPAQPGGAIVFFTPEAGVTPHFVAQCIVARTLKERGHRVIMVRCFQCFQRCPVMDMVQLPYGLDAEGRRDTCLQCADVSLRYLDAYGLDHLDLRSLETPELLASVRAAVRDAPADLRGFEFRSVAFGRLTVMDLALSLKISQLDVIDEATRTAWLDYLEASVTSFLLVEEICRRMPVRALLHCENYPMLLAARMSAARLGVPSVVVTHPAHRNVDRQRLVFSHQPATSFVQQHLDDWPSWRDRPLPSDTIRDIGDDLHHRFRGRGSHQYSPPTSYRGHDIRSELGLSTSKPLIVAYTSSLDEAMADVSAREVIGMPHVPGPQPFAHQVEWLSALVEHVERRDDVQLVVRVHPREGPGRVAGESQHLDELKSLFRAPRASCHFIWPDDPVSSYDLGEAADLVLTSWSSIGFEFARLGAPVLAMSDAITAFPRGDFIDFAPTRAEYFASLQRLLGAPANLERVKRAWRWYFLTTLAGVVDLSDVVPRSNARGLPRFRTPHNAALIERIVLEGIDPVALASANAAVAPAALTEETDALRRELRRVVHSMITGRSMAGDFALVLDPAERTRLPSGAHVIRIDGALVRYTVGSRTRVRYSPLTARLAPLCTS